MSYNQAPPRRSPTHLPNGRVVTQLDRIEAKLDALLEALADEGEETGIDVTTLDGQTIVARERDDSQPL